MTDLAAHLKSQLVDIGDGLAGAFSTLARDPRPDTCESLAVRLQGAARHVMQLREAIRESDEIKKAARALSRSAA